MAGRLRRIAGDAGLALSLLTVVPTPARHAEKPRPTVAAWFPAVGGALGAVGYGLVKLAEKLGAVHRAPLLVAALLVVVWALLTRMLHWDGLADVADGYWGSHEPRRRLEIMADSHTGAFGATAVALVAIVEVTAMGTMLPDHQSPLLIIAVCSRLAATAGAWLGVPARTGGLGASIMGRPTAGGLGVAALPVLAVSVVGWFALGSAGVALSIAGVFTALAVPHVLAARFGGVTGDVMGASVLLTEAVLLSAAALVL